MMAEELPLLELFTQLREAGLLLGIEEYRLLVRALQGGFGGDRLSLKLLCETLWVKSPTDKSLFDYHFELLVKRTGKVPIEATPPAEEVAREKTEELETAIARTAEFSQPLALQIEDEVEVAKSVAATTPTDEKIHPHPFILTEEYFPVTRRQMKQSWRYLRRPVREGIPVELDLETTVREAGRSGILLEPMLLPRHANRAELLLFIDRYGSMVLFHCLCDRLKETALRGGRLGKAGIYYFHNCPVEYLYRDPHLQEAQLVGKILSCLGQRTAILIVSDGGAARGNYSRERFELTENFLQQLKKQARYIAWVNPMPSERWDLTTAGEIASLVPMFEIARQGLHHAIDVLRGLS